MSRQLKLAIEMESKRESVHSGHLIQAPKPGNVSDAQGTPLINMKSSNPILSQQNIEGHRLTL